MSSTATATGGWSELIAPDKTKDDWTKFARQLVPGGNSNIWTEAFEKFLLARLRSRYLNPIEMIRDNGKWEGEGFAIVSIQCALIEFLAATRVGKNYRHRNPQPPHEYKRSRELFVDFLFQTTPFDTLFLKGQAQDFYTNVRCALLHEARTKDGWIIRATGAIAVDCQKKVVYRDNFERIIEDYIRDYGIALTSNSLLQEAFLRKYNDLAT